jgi:hypothetical protein
MKRKKSHSKQWKWICGKTISQFSLTEENPNYLPHYNLGAAVEILDTIPRTSSENLRLRFLISFN